jgi:hypothetical protein
MHVVNINEILLYNYFILIKIKKKKRRDLLQESGATTLRTSPTKEASMPPRRWKG